jgi:CRISPR-associated endonuclease/helicase Cas3
MSFSGIFLLLTERDPFPWQQRLYDRFIGGQIPASSDLPTGLGKTSVVAIWWCGRSSGPRASARAPLVSSLPGAVTLPGALRRR